MDLIVSGELGEIRDSLESTEGREARELEEALAASLSLAPPIHIDVVRPLPKAGPPPPPRLARPLLPLNNRRPVLGKRHAYPRSFPRLDMLGIGTPMLVGLNVRASHDDVAVPLC